MRLSTVMISADYFLVFWQLGRDDPWRFIISGESVVFKNHEFCFQSDETFNNDDELCIQNDEICIQNGEFCIENDEFCIENDEFRDYDGVGAMGMLV